MRVVHYLNQFFGGIGGEEQAGLPASVRSGPVGPGRLLETFLPEDSLVVSSIVCGDNYAAENLEELRNLVVETIKEANADLLVAGPCFEAGRYGTAAGSVCAAVRSQLGIPAVSGMDLENPGADLFRSEVYIVDSGPNASDMRDVLAKMAALGSKLVDKTPLARPSDEGYIPQGMLRSELVTQSAAQRMAAMLLSKLKGEPYQSEVLSQRFEPVTAPPPVADFSKATVALITDGGLVPKGNPDRIPRAFARVWGAYGFAGQDSLNGQDYEVAHGGYDVSHVQADPDRLVPVDVLREFEQNGFIGKLHDEFYSTTGNANPLENSRRMGREMAQRLKDAGVDAVILTST